MIFFVLSSRDEKLLAIQAVRRGNATSLRQILSVSLCLRGRLRLAALCHMFIDGSKNFSPARSGDTVYLSELQDAANAIVQTGA